MPNSMLKVGSGARGVRTVRVTSGRSKSPPANAGSEIANASAANPVADSLAESFIVVFEGTRLGGNHNPSECLIASARIKVYRVGVSLQGHERQEESHLDMSFKGIGRSGRRVIL